MKFNCGLSIIITITPCLLLLLSLTAQSEVITKDWCLTKEYSTSPCESLATAYKIAKNGDFESALLITKYEIKTLQTEYILSKDLTGSPSEKTVLMIKEYKAFYERVIKSIDAMINKAIELNRIDMVNELLNIKQSAKTMNDSL